MDVLKTFIANGSSHGEVRTPDFILASTGRVAIDIEEVKTIQQHEEDLLARVNVEEILHIKCAKELEIAWTKRLKM